MLTVTSRAVTALLVFVSSPLARCAESKEESSFVKASSGYPSPTATVTVDWLYSSGVDEPSSFSSTTSSSLPSTVWTTAIATTSTWTSVYILPTISTLAITTSPASASPSPSTSSSSSSTSTAYADPGSAQHSSSSSSSPPSQKSSWTGWDPTTNTGHHNPAPTTPTPTVTVSSVILCSPRSRTSSTTLRTSALTTLSTAVATVTVSTSGG